MKPVFASINAKTALFEGNFLIITNK